MVFAFRGCLLSVALFALSASAAEQPKEQAESVADLVAGPTTVREVAAGFTFTE
jgi:hypothetical protein